MKRAYKSRKKYHNLLYEQVDELTALQRLHYASNGYAVLVIFQGMDAAGKDGAIRQVMSGVNPQGCQVFSFQQPSAEELDHDFLWRTTRRLPERGRIGIFNRSYYEEVLIVRVHPDVLADQGLPDELLNEKALWRGRYQSIMEHESHLHRNGTRIIKVFLHQSKDEQRKRFLKRIMIRTRTGTSPSPTSKRGNCGNVTCRRTRRVSARRARQSRPGTSSPPMTRRTHG